MSPSWKEINVTTRKVRNGKNKFEKGAFAWNKRLCLEQWKGRERESRTKNDTHQGTWPVGALTDSFWLCYAKSLAGKRKGGISGSRRRPMPTPWESIWKNEKRNQMKKKNQQHNGVENI